MLFLSRFLKKPGEKKITRERNIAASTQQIPFFAEKKDTSSVPLNFVSRDFDVPDAVQISPVSVQEEIPLQVQEQSQVNAVKAINSIVSDERASVDEQKAVRSTTLTVNAVIQQMPDNEEDEDVENKDDSCVEGIDFYGGAQPLSKIVDGTMELIAQEGPAQSYATVNFKQEVNLRDNSLVFLARGAQGGEVLKISVVDSNRRAMHTDDMYRVALTADWQEIAISQEVIPAGSINASSVAYIKLIIGTGAREKNSGAAMYIKDFSLKKAQ